MLAKRIVLALVAFVAVSTATSLARANNYVTVTFSSGAQMRVQATSVTFATGMAHVEIGSWSALTAPLIASLGTNQPFTASVEVTTVDGRGKEWLSETRKYLGAQVSALSLSFAASGSKMTLSETMDLGSAKWETLAAPPNTAVAPVSPAYAPPALDSALVTIGASQSAVFAANLSFTTSTSVVNGLPVRKVTVAPFTFTEAAGPVSKTLQLASDTSRVVDALVFDVGAGPAGPQHNASYKLTLKNVRVVSLASQSSGNVSTDAASVNAGALLYDDVPGHASGSYTTFVRGS
jgi:hypothetical protein